MTETDRRTAIALELRHGESSLKAATTLRADGLHNDALSRLYYALFHHVSALLLTEGVEPRRHSSIPGMLGKHFLPTGILTAAQVGIVSRTYAFRELADYERTWEATSDVFDSTLKEVEPLIRHILETLRKQGWIE